MILRRRVIIVFVAALMLALALGGTWVKMPARAQESQPGRFKTVETQVTQYVWELVDRASGAVICEVLIEREGQPTDQDVLNVCQDRIYPATATPVTGLPQPLTTVVPLPTQAPFNFPKFMQGTLWRLKETRVFTRVVKVPLPDLVLNIQVPDGALATPYVTLMAYEPVVEYHITSIQGTINQSQFTCDGGVCNVPISGPSQITFKAYSSFGDSSQEVTATIQVVQQSDGTHLFLTALSPFNVFQDSCAQIWGITEYSPPEWATFTQLPVFLNTNKTLHYLASQLITTGLVDAKDCPGAGLTTAASPNACGLERARSAMIAWQNQYDPIIWSVGREVGVPPRLLKTLIETESQFWPGNARNFIEEFGLAQINYIGADVALRYNQSLYTLACTGVLSDCSTPFAKLPTWQQEMLRGNLIKLVNASCVTCGNGGIDMNAANQSIELIANVLKANCSQANYVLKEIQTTAKYEDMWKFTLVSYHSGFQCLYDALDQASRAQAPTDWPSVSSYLACPGAKAYVDDLWTSLTNFDSFVLRPAAEPAGTPLHLPTIFPTRTPIPVPTAVPSSNTIRVFVYMILPDKPFPDNVVWLDGVLVEVELSDGATYFQTVSNGETVFNVAGHPVGTTVTVSLPGLYRSYTTRLTQQGEIFVPFRLVQPTLPGTLP